MKLLKIFFVCLLFAGFQTLSALPRPLIQYDFSKVTKDGTIPNLAGNQYPGKIIGSYKQLPGGVLQFDGKSGRIEVTGSEDLDVSHDTTFSIVYRKGIFPGNSKPDLAMDAFFSKGGSFVMSRISNNLYANVHDGKKWNANCQASYVFEKRNGQFNHIAMSMHYVNNINDSEEYVEITFYLNGKQVQRKKFKDVRIASKKKPLEIASGTSMGTPWLLGGEIADARVYNRVLTDSEIRELVMEQGLAAPEFKQNASLSSDMQQKISRLPLSAQYKSAIANLLLSGKRQPSLQQITSAPEKYFIEIKGPQSSLVILKSNSFSHILSWYDHRTKRELLAPRSPWVSWIFEQNKKLYAIDPFNPQVKSEFIPGTSSAEFTIRYTCKPGGIFPVAFKAESKFRFRNDKLEFSHTAKSESAGTIVHTVEYPKVNFNALDAEKEKLLVPSGCGFEQKQPTVKGFYYSNPYPRAFASMQFTAYYDGRSGIFVSPADPRGRIKQISLEGVKNTMSVTFGWRVPYDAPGKPNRFDAQCTSVLQLFRGGWYEASMLYRLMLNDIKAAWWVRPNRTPEYFRNNCWWLHEAYFGFIEQNFIDVKNYIGLDCFRVDVWSWWERGPCIHLGPTMRANPEWIEYMNHMRKNGIRAIPYTDGRLWTPQDRRGEDYLYSKYGKPNAVISDGKRIVERYAFPVDVICPFTKGYQDTFSEFLIRLGAQGADGIYIDQLGATFQPPCHQTSHGHRYADWDAWNLNGYAKMLTKVRETWQKRGWQKFLTTEDNAEYLIGLIDGMEGYRWFNEGQVPAYQAVYSGKMQCYNRRTCSVDAKFQSLTEQLLYGEQLGAFSVRELAFPFIPTFRHFAKKMIRLRHALLPVFNQGIMARPPEFKHPLKQNRRLWGMFGSKFITKPSVQSAAWKLHNTLALILVNTEAETVRNTLMFEAPAKDCEYTLYASDGKISQGRFSEKQIKYDFSLPGRSFFVLTLSPAGKKDAALHRRITQDLKLIASVDTERDPYTNQYPQKQTVIALSSGEPMNLTNCAMLRGARNNRKEGFIDYNYLTFIYVGKCDFGAKSPKSLQIEVACPQSFTGAVSFYADEILPENKLVEVMIPTSFKTQNAKTFRYISAPVMKKITGQHNILMTCDGFFTYNLRNFKVTY